MPEPATGTVHARWLAVMEEIQAIPKSQQTEGGSRFNFRGVDQVVDAVGPMLRKHGVFVVPLESTVEHRSFSSKSGTPMLEAFVTARWRVHGVEGDHFEMGTVGQASDASDKATAQASSVAFRIALLQGLCVPTGDPDPDHHHVDRSGDDEEARAGGWQDAAERAAAWEAGLQANGELPEGVKDPTIAAWAKKIGLGPSLTKAQAEEWMTLIAEVKDAPAGEAEDAVEAEGEDSTEPKPWKSKAEAKRTWESLLARQGRLLHVDRDALVEWGRSIDLSPDTFTRAQAEDWLAKIMVAELHGEEPF